MLRTDDVIHSFWVPQLNRKIDMIPGQPQPGRAVCRQAGRYRGQCAEFCGLQHAHMAMYVVRRPARPVPRLAAPHEAAAARRRPPRRARGEQVFPTSGCASCHTIRGTRARGDVGPDLTHVGSRATLAALTIPQHRAELARWIARPAARQARQPDAGARPTGDAEIGTLVAYLEGLREWWPASRTPGGPRRASSGSSGSGPSGPACSAG